MKTYVYDKNKKQVWTKSQEAKLVALCQQVADLQTLQSHLQERYPGVPQETNLSVKIQFLVRDITALEVQKLEAGGGGTK